MDSVSKLLSSLEAFEQRFPERREFASGMRDAIERIMRDFEGPVRDRLLLEACQTLEQQISLQRSAREARAALEKLEAQQEALAESLVKLSFRPPNATIH